MEFKNYSNLIRTAWQNVDIKYGEQNNSPAADNV
jgi:hypothetical protein